MAFRIGPVRQHGQAMLFFALTVLACLLVAIAVFNVGQTVSEKMRLTNTADAAAYSGALWEARTLNFQAYTNRAMVANEVAIGQAVSIVSWVAYLQTVTQNLNDYLFWVPYLGEVLEEVNNGVKMFKRRLDDFMPGAIKFLDMAVSGLSASQGFAHAAAVAAVPGIVAEVVKANDPQSDVTALSDMLMAAHLARWNGFTKTYSGAERERFKEVTMNSRDGFTRQRNWTLPMPWIPVDAPPDLIMASPMATAKKRGGTDLVGLDEWRGVDTLAEHYDYLGWCSLGKVSYPCWKTNYEARLAYGAATVYNTKVGQSSATGYHGNAPSENPRTYRKAMDEIVDLSNSGGGGFGGMFGSGVFSGLPKYRDIADLTAKNPTLALPVEVAKKSGAIRTSVNAGIGSGRLRLPDCYAGREISALSKAEVYFAHPDSYAGYGSRFNRAVEYGSLFNPYWQVRLVAPSVTEVNAARLSKGPC